MTHLRKHGIMEVRLQIWVGHSMHGVADKNSVHSLRNDVAHRRRATERAARIYDNRSTRTHGSQNTLG